ncbi:hypothetical protein V8F20_000409 [Naviculisporaceae sp. PSN 640]
MEAPAQNTLVRAPGREHIPLFPKGFIAVRILQLIFGVIVLGLGAFGVWWSSGLYDGPIFILVVALFTLITSIYHLVAEYGAPSIYNYWAVLGLDIFMVVMWLSSFALLASQVAAWFSYSYYDSWTGYVYGLSRSGEIVVSCLAAASALGGVEFLLHLISLILVGVNLHRHRAAGGHCMPRAPGAPAPAAPAAAVAAPAPVAPEAEKPMGYAQVAPQPTPSPAPAYIQPYPVQPQPQPQFQPQPQPQYQQPQPQYQQPQQQFYPQQPPNAAQLPTNPQ